LGDERQGLGLILGFFETAAKGRSISTHRKNEITFSQGDTAEAVFYIKKGKVKVTVVSKKVSRDGAVWRRSVPRSRLSYFMKSFAN
jgi:hypothetical protein